ncbi:unnamed protein product [Haemonchus placei]|uniref:Uncharacterized protein n=1 Tax=Haemonchus placei TaxID=6290 RepID=A0A0N4WM22_HAEPC|nr:unnamed protein product [Haemonchus placei]
MADIFSSSSRRTVHVELLLEARIHNPLRNAIRRFGTVDADTNSAHIDLCVRLGRISSGMDPSFEFVATKDLATLLRPNLRTVAHSSMDAAYASSPRPGQDERCRAPLVEPSITVSKNTL